MNRILALDLGTACGWAYLKPGELVPCGVKGGHPIPWEMPSEIAYGTFDLRHGRFAGGGVRFVRFRDALEPFTGQVDEVVFESVQRHAGTAAAHCYGGLLAVLQVWCETNGTPYDGRSVQAIKKFATGRGNADKMAVVNAVEGWGFSPRNDNEADAIALLRLRMSEIEPHDSPVPVSSDSRKMARGADRKAAL